MGVVVPLRTLFKEPFGPWRDRDVLNNNWQTNVNRILTLDELLLTRGDEAVGLDATDLLPPDDSQEDAAQAAEVDPVFFMAVLSIDEPRKRLFDNTGTRKNLLTDVGWGLLEKQWKERAGNNERWKDSHLKDMPTLKIKIVGQVCNSVRYLEADDKYAPNGLKLVAQYDFGGSLRHRTFAIDSLHPTTYNLSRSYMAHAVFLRALRDIAADDKDNTPYDMRDLDWAVGRYIIRKMDAPMALQTFRPLFDKTDSDMKMSDPKEPSRRFPDGTLRKGKKRIARVRGRTEVQSYFAIHSPWLLLNSDQTHVRRLNLNLEAWGRQTLALRKTADLAANSLSDSWFGRSWTAQPEDQEKEVRRFRKLMETKKIKNPRKVKQKPPSIKPRSPSPIPMEVDDLPDYDDLQDFEYSDADTEPEVFTSEEEGENDVLDKSDLELFSRLPTWGMEMPTLEDDRLWHCPDRSSPEGECGYSVSLWMLTDEEAALLPNEVARHLRKPRGEWRISDPWVVNALRTIVDAHYVAHLEELNIERTCQLIQGTVHVSFKWINAPREPRGP